MHSASSTLRATKASSDVFSKTINDTVAAEIGRKFGGRDHTTVMHAVRKVDELREHDVTFKEDVELLRRMLEVKYLDRSNFTVNSRI